MPFYIETIITGVTQQAWQVFLMIWWLLVPIFLASIFWKLWIFHIQTKHINGLKWILLRVKTPQDIAKTPKAMEQIFSAVHGSYSFGIKPMDKYWRGVVEDWHTFEIIGDASGVRFYIRTTEGYRNMIESAVYSQYPGAEIEIVDDYINDLPVLVPNDSYELFGSEFILTRDDGYPIKTYPELEAMEKEEKLDSLATLLEAMSRLKGSERIWIQIVARPTSDDWKKKAEALRDKLAGRKEVKKMTFSDKLVEFIKNLIMAPIREPEWAEESKPEKPSIGTLTKGEQDVIRAIEAKTAKIGFESVIRFVYIGEKEEFNRGNVSSVMGALRQFSTLHLNGFRPNLNTMTITFGKLKKFFKKRRVYIKKRRIYDDYRSRAFPQKFSILNTEELATIYHFPSFIIEAPGLQPVEFKKGTPPPNLPV